MSDALLGVGLNQPVAFRLFIDGELDQIEKHVFASPLAERGLDVDFLIREEAASEVALGGET